MGRKIASFTQLKVWQKGHLLVLKVYKLTKKFPEDKKHGLNPQMRHAAVFITSNIAEGFRRIDKKEKANFYNLFLGSLIELKNQLLITKDLNYLKLTKNLVNLTN